MGETMMLGLRLLHDGVSTKKFRLRHGVSIEEQFGSQLDRLQELGLLVIEEEQVRLSPRGSMLANAVCAEFI
jgi:oxygen-independent coproporphyrinogen-3 oxidase